MASLVPQVTYVSASSGEPSASVLEAWPGWGVQQDLGPLRGTVGRLSIWVAGEQGRESRLTVSAWLLDAESGDVLRQTTIDVASAHIPVLRALDFPQYVVPDGQRLRLQLQVAEDEESSVSYRLAYRQPGYRNVELNGVANAGDGPLALTHQTTSSGLRAAILGKQSERVRLALAVVASVLAALIHPWVIRRLHSLAYSLAYHPMAWARRRAERRMEPQSSDADSRLGSLLSMPWYPWLMVIAFIIHFMSTNQLYFDTVEMFSPILIALVIVTSIVTILRFILKDWHRASAVTVVVNTVFFGYGHIQSVLGSKIDERLVFSGAIVLGSAIAVAALRSESLVRLSAQPLNLATAVLIAFPVASLMVGLSKSLAPEYSSDSVSTRHPAAHLSLASLPTDEGVWPDIYYIILDEYGRHDLLGDLDNTHFIDELERRGFYVAREATTNYSRTITSLSSSLNLAYIDDLQGQSDLTDADKSDLISNHALGAVLKDLGYTYVHLESGHPYSDRSQIADFLVKFTRAGVVMNKNTVDRRGIEPAVMESRAALLPGYFGRELVQTTILPAIVGGDGWVSGNAAFEPLEWWSPYRTLQTFDFLSGPIAVDSPKFVFAHIIKPHTPGTFDRDGNIIAEGQHGNEAYFNQLIYLNLLLLEMIDTVLEGNANDSILVVVGDHGRDPHWGPGFSREGILAAFHLPDGGERELYPSISSVNHFRVILNFYFGLDLKILEDRKMLNE